MKDELWSIKATHVDEGPEDAESLFEVQELCALGVEVVDLQIPKLQIR